MKIKWGLTVFIVLLLTFVPVTSAKAPLKLYVNGQPVISVGSPAVKVMDHTLFVDIHAINSELKLDVESNNENNAIYISNKGEPQSEVVATLRKAKATLYATKREGHLEKFRLEIDGGVKHFPDWRSSDAPAFGPRLFFEDINQDGNKELVIILTTGHGTGTIITKAHVLQKTKTNIGEIYEEKLIENPEVIIYKNVKSKKKSNHEVEIVIGKKKTTDSVDPYMAGEIVDYSVVNNELVVYMRGQLTPISEGGILITYQFEDHLYQLKEIEYLKKRPDFIMDSSYQ